MSRVVARRFCIGALVLASCTRAEPTPTAQPGPPASTASTAMERGEDMHAPLVRSIEGVLPMVAKLPAERTQALDRIAAFVAAKHAAGQPARLTFICTANSRRSHLAQLWAAAAATYYGVDGVETHSGGTEASAFNPRAIAAIERAGFVVEPLAEGGENPHYRVSWSDSAPAIDAFSKRYDDPSNPTADFVAVMTCSEADEACPLVPGAALRVSLAYDDPKVADGTPEETARYDERSHQIAAEMLYLFSRVAAPSSVDRADSGRPADDEPFASLPLAVSSGARP